jgi:hypothetical protein
MHRRVFKPGELLSRLWGTLLFIVFIPTALEAATWVVSDRIPLSNNVVRIVADPGRPWVYGIDKENSDILFINLETRSVQKRLYVGKDPTDADLDVTTNLLYVANKGPGTGVPGSWRIGVIELTNQTLVRSYITAAVPINLTAGRPGRLYYNSGFENWNGGDAHIVNTDTGEDLGTFAIIKTRMVISNGRTRLFGQYTYTGNLGAMGVFDVSTDSPVLVDYQYYSPYPYGWDYDNYYMSGDNRHLSYGKVLFNPTNLLDQVGQFEEQVFALSSDGSTAFGQRSIWDCTTFPIHGDAARIAYMPFQTSIMTFDTQQQVLYAFNPTDTTLYSIERVTQNGIPFRWLTRFNLSTNDTIEQFDGDQDGLTTLQEWSFDTNPTNASAPLKLRWVSNSKLLIENTSPSRRYELYRNTNLSVPIWSPITNAQGTASNLLFEVPLDARQAAGQFFRIRPRW